jgi:hypothetical protein
VLFKNRESVEAPCSEPVRLYRLNQLAIVEKASERKANFFGLVIFCDLGLVLSFVGPRLVILLYGREIATREFAEIEIACGVVLVL